MGNENQPFITYFVVFIGLIILLLLTVGAASLELGPLSIVVALGIAAIKALLILWFFMHIRVSSLLVRIFASAGFLGLLVLFSITLFDYLTRSTM